jgi:hypothetical protein
MAISYGKPLSGKKNPDRIPIAIPDSSLTRINRQAREVHDRVEWIRRNCKYKPLIFCLTSPIESDYKLGNESVSKFFDNLKSSYDCGNYIWVREYQENGRPHWHCVADSKYLDGVELSRYWSSLFNCTNVNSVRLGTNPERPPRRFFVDSPLMARYLTKYLGIGYKKVDGKKVKCVRVKHESQLLSKTKNFGSSQEVIMKTKPMVFEELYSEFSMKRPVRNWKLSDDSYAHLFELFPDGEFQVPTFNDKKFSWINPNPLHRVYYGIPKRS